MTLLVEVVKSCSLRSEDDDASATGVSTADSMGVEVDGGVVVDEATPRISEIAVADFDARPFDAICRARCARCLRNYVLACTIIHEREVPRHLSVTNRTCKTMHASPEEH